MERGQSKFRLTGSGRENPEWSHERHDPSDVVRVKQRLDITEWCEQHDPAWPLATTLLLPTLFGFKSAHELHRYTRAEAVPDDEHALRRSAMRAKPVPCGVCVEGEPGLARCTRRVAVAAVVDREDVRAQAGREGLVVLHARR